MEEGTEKMRHLFKTVNVEGIPGECEPFSLDYYLLEKEVCIESKCMNRFGVEIYKRARRIDGTAYAEYRKIFDVFQTAEEAIQVLELMARNTVTPISMKDILEDLLGIAEFTCEVMMSEAV